MSGATLDGELNADSLQVGGALYMRSDGSNKASFKNVTLSGAKVTGEIDMDGASFDGELKADGLQAGDVFMRSAGNNKASFLNVSLVGAKVTGEIDMDGASFDGELNADGLQVGGPLFELRRQEPGQFPECVAGRREGDWQCRDGRRELRRRS